MSFISSIENILKSTYKVDILPQDIGQKHYSQKMDGF